MKKEFDATIPIYLQIMEEFKRELAAGEREPGGKVESVRDMAQSMGVNPNTVQRAFAELEREGLLFSERTSGRYVTNDAEKIGELKKNSARRLIDGFVRQMSELGFSGEEILKLVKAYMEEKKNG